MLSELGAQLADVPPELARDLLEQSGAADGSELKRIKGVVENSPWAVATRLCATQPIAAR